METPLNRINYLNVIAFLLSWTLNSEVDIGPDNALGFFGFIGSMRELARQYDSIITPVELTFLVSHLVLLFHGVFAVTQCLPKYRGSILVQEGVKYWFFASMLTQLIWTWNFGLDDLIGSILSVLFAALMAFFTSQTLMSQASLTDENQTHEEYWLLRFPFSLQTGWTLAIFILTINGLAREIGLGDLILLIIGFVSLTAFAAISWKMLKANGSRPNYAIPGVLAWFVLGMTFEPKAEFEGYIGLAFSITTFVVGAAIAVFTGYLFYINEIRSGRFKFPTQEGDEKTAYIAPHDSSVA